MKKIFILSLLGLCFATFAGSASAQLLIEQGKLDLNVSAGQKTVDSISVHNTSKDTALHIKVYWADFMYVAPFKGKKKFLTAGTTEYSCSQWIKFSPSEFVIEPMSKQSINYSIEMPSHPLGGYYGVLFFETGSKKAEGQVGVNIVSRLGSLFFVETDSAKRSIEISNVDVTETAIKGVLKNTGNVILLPKGIYYVMNDEGLVEARGEMEEFYLPADNEVEFSFELGSELDAGSYFAVLTFDLGDGESVVEELDFTKNADGTLIINKI